MVAVLLMTFLNNCNLLSFRLLTLCSELTLLTLQNWMMQSKLRQLHIIGAFWLEAARKLVTTKLVKEFPSSCHFNDAKLLHHLGRNAQRKVNIKTTTTTMKTSSNFWRSSEAFLIIYQFSLIPFAVGVAVGCWCFTVMEVNVSERECAGEREKLIELEVIEFVIKIVFKRIFREDFHFLSLPLPFPRFGFDM